MERNSDTPFTVILSIYILIEIASFIVSSNGSSNGIGAFFPEVRVWLNTVFA